MFPNSAFTSVNALLHQQLQYCARLVYTLTAEVKLCSTKATCRVHHTTRVSFQQLSVVVVVAL